MVLPDCFAEAHPLHRYVASSLYRDSELDQAGPALRSCSAYSTVTSVRLFWARPSSVSLEATGLVSP